MKDSYSFDRDEEGLDRSYELHSGRLRADLRPLRPALVPGRVRRRDDGRLRRPRVHGALRGRRERGRAGARATRPTSRSPPPSRSRSSCRRRSTRPRRSRRPGLTTVEEVSGALGVPAGALIKALPVMVEGRGMVLVLVRGDHRLNEIKLRNALGADFRPAARGGDRGRARPARLHRPGRRRAAGHQGRGDRRRLLRLPAPTGPTPTCAASSPGATSSSRRSTSARSRPATPRPAAARSRSSRRSRSATSSSSAPATRSRSARPTSTRTGRSSRS